MLVCRKRSIITRFPDEAIHIDLEGTYDPPDLGPDGHNAFAKITGIRKKTHHHRLVHIQLSTIQLSTGICFSAIQLSTIQVSTGMCSGIRLSATQLSTSHCVGFTCNLGMMVSLCVYVLPNQAFINACLTTRTAAASSRRLRLVTSRRPTRTATWATGLTTQGGTSRASSSRTSGTSSSARTVASASHQLTTVGLSTVVLDDDWNSARA